MTVIPLGPGLPRGSSHLPADLSEQPFQYAMPARAASAYLVLLRVEVAAFHPPRLLSKARRLVSVALFLVFAEGEPSTSTYGR